MGIGVAWFRYRGTRYCNNLGTFLMAAILILASNHLTNAPRVVKEADALAADGHDVTVFGTAIDVELTELDRQLHSSKKWHYEAVCDLRPLGFATHVHNVHERIRSKLAKLSVKHLDLFAPASLGYSIRKIRARALKFRADLTIVHSESGLWIGRELLNDRRNVGVDFEDWFSEDLPLAARMTRPTKMLQTLEAELLQRCSYRVTTSYALANALAAKFGSTPPEVILNVFPWKDRSELDGKTLDRKSSDSLSVHWFSQTVGAGRGLEDLFSILPNLAPNVEIHLRGNCSAGFRAHLAQVSQRSQVTVHRPVPAPQLLSRIAEHDLGLALEQAFPVSRNLSISNKFFQYLLGGLAVIATDIAGQQEAAKRASEAMVLLAPNKPDDLLRAINSLADDRPRLLRMKQEALRCAREVYCWEQQIPLYQSFVRRALAQER